MEMDAEQVIAKALTPFVRSENKRDEAVEKVYEALGEAGFLVGVDGPPDTVLIGKTSHTWIQHVKGVEIGVDTAGNASYVHVPGARTMDITSRKNLP